MSGNTPSATSPPACTSIELRRSSDHETTRRGCFSAVEWLWASESCSDWAAEWLGLPQQTHRPAATVTNHKQDQQDQQDQQDTACNFTTPQLRARPGLVGAAMGSDLLGQVVCTSGGYPHIVQ
ncbi:hypothetical protein ACRE_079310 [Hapsidospora chrysogenum ATCC 11550]|uniref:Uncharacterized protein n=1 Tax=Hapsidospora chrysogenum (strain ATCC 11550 / CBS 779.69 / DSM 880 / IAM 14645 / JCM 23072 / IMI 49137) TaxID=857340 RepID=A0A086SW95_HAPC1|nr:hypothetical protein ACRE_079310 [Hapsidospora chrysogenum ATCC 11550]